jgi:hypothetical protein
MNEVDDWFVDRVQTVTSTDLPFARAFAHFLKVSKCLRAQIELRADVYADLSRILSCDYAHCSSAPSYTTPYKLAEGDSSNNKHRS